MFLLVLCALSLCFSGTEPAEVCEECQKFQLHTDYCLPHAVVLGNVRLRRWWDATRDYYIISINQIFRRSFKVKAEVVRVLTDRNCGVNLEMGASYIIGVNTDDTGTLSLPQCSLALKYTEVERSVRGVITKRRIDCSCTEDKCGINTCNTAHQVRHK
eukprot:sb/3473014/